MNYSGTYVMLPGARLEIEGDRPVETLGNTCGCGGPCCGRAMGDTPASAASYLGFVAIIGISAFIAYQAWR